MTSEPLEAAVVGVTIFVERLDLLSDEESDFVTSVNLVSRAELCLAAGGPGNWGWGWIRGRGLGVGVGMGFGLAFTAFRSRRAAFSSTMKSSVLRLVAVVEEASSCADWLAGGLVKMDLIVDVDVGNGGSTMADEMVFRLLRVAGKGGLPGTGTEWACALATFDVRWPFGLAVDVVDEIDARLVVVWVFSSTASVVLMAVAQDSDVEFELELEPAEYVAI